MTRSYYEKFIPEAELIEIFNSEDYWTGQTSGFKGGACADQEAKQAYFDKIADKIAAVRIRRPQTLPGVGCCDQFLRRLPPRDVLDVGCGVGYLVKALRERGVEAYGIDVASWAIEHAVTPYVEQRSLFDLQARLRKYSLVVSHDMLEHIPITLLPRAVSVLNSIGQRNYHIISCGSLPDDHDITHVTMHTLGWWKRRLPMHWKIEMKDKVL